METESSMEETTVLNKDLSDQNEDNKYEPFTFELKPDLHYVPDKTEQESSSSASSSMYSDDDDDDDFIQLDTIALGNSFPNPSTNNGSSAISSMNSKPNELLFVPTQQPVFSARPVETMNYFDKPAAQDASRIPSSIFTTQSTVPQEWSIASAESLFSLNFSNSSYTLENASFNGLPPDSPATPTTPASAISMVSDVSLQGFGGPLAILEETIKDANDEVVKEDGVVLEPNGERLDVSDTNLHRSGSTSSMQSFAFPVLTGNEKTESIKAVPETQRQPQLESQPDLTEPSISLSAKPESETKSEAGPALPPSSNSEQLTQPPQTLVMTGPDRQEPPTVTDTDTATNERPDTHDATKASNPTNNSSGSFCSCCSFGS